MIKAEDLRIGDIVQTNKDCMFPKDTLCIVTEIHPDRQFNDKNGALNIMRKVVGDSYVSRIANSGHSFCPVRYSNPFVRIV